MFDLPERFIVEARSMRVGDPSIRIFHTKVTAGARISEETHGSKQQLQSFLEGMKSALWMVGYASHMLGWEIPDHWVEPSGRRWTMPREGIGEVEELDSEGQVIRI